jgi:hypothetical protein
MEKLRERAMRKISQRSDCDGASQSDLPLRPSPVPVIGVLRTYIRNTQITPLDS